MVGCPNPTVSDRVVHHVVGDDLGLSRVHGFRPDLYQGTGGNNIAMQLVIDG